MMILLKSVGLPPEFEETEDYVVGVEEEPQIIGEMFVFCTELPLAKAADSLTEWYARHWGAPVKTQGEISQVLMFAARQQSVTIQITDFGDDRQGYISAKTNWEWPKT